MKFFCYLTYLDIRVIAFHYSTTQSKDRRKSCCGRSAKAGQGASGGIWGALGAFEVAILNGRKTTLTEVVTWPVLIWRLQFCFLGSASVLAFVTVVLLFGRPFWFETQSGTWSQRWLNGKANSSLFPQPSMICNGGIVFEFRGFWVPCLYSLHCKLWSIVRA